jgi:ABC-2 type transport system ATP-binding protein
MLVVTLAEATSAEIVVAGATVVSHESNVVHLRFDRRTTSAEVLIRRVTERYTISDIAIVEPEIESIVRRIYTDGYARPEALPS